MSDDAETPLRDYRETVFLPQTPFPMRAGLPQAEPKQLEKLGEGGIGQVFKARNWRLGKVVALKIIGPKRLGNEQTARRFEREIRKRLEWWDKRRAQGAGKAPADEPDGDDER